MIRIITIISIKYGSWKMVIMVMEEGNLTFKQISMTRFYFF